MESFKTVQGRYLDGTTGKCLVSMDIPVQKLNRHTSSSKSSINLTLRTGSSFSLKLSRSVSFSTLISTCSNIFLITLSRCHPCLIALLQFINFEGTNPRLQLFHIKTVQETKSTITPLMGLNGTQSKISYLFSTSPTMRTVNTRLKDS